MRWKRKSEFGFAGFWDEQDCCVGFFLQILAILKYCLNQDGQDFRMSRMCSIVCNLKRIILKILKSRKSKFRQHPAHPEILAILIQTISEDEQDVQYSMQP